jgi:hypothetical protein
MLIMEQVDNINVIEAVEAVETVEVVVKKRGRKKKVEVVDLSNCAIIPEKVVKKRGRKPKGGKIMIKPELGSTTDSIITNVILHLKCSTQDLDQHNRAITQIISDPVEYIPIAPPNILTYNSNANGNNMYDYKNDINEQSGITIQDNAYNRDYSDGINTICKACSAIYEADTTGEPDDGDTSNNENDNNNEIMNKIKQLKIQLYNNVSYDKKSACFWCTYGYDNEPYYIPKTEINGEIMGYGSFCRPECAVAYLLKENIDDSVKFDRYQLINTVYGKTDGYKRNIKPSSDPYYTLDKFYGNLTIQEYRKLLNNGHLLNVVEKPMTRILPELHEDIENTNDSALASIKTTGFKVKKQSEKQKGPSKNSIMKEKFGIL